MPMIRWWRVRRLMMGWYNNEGQLRVEGRHPAKSVLLSWSAPPRDLPTTPHNTSLWTVTKQSAVKAQLWRALHCFGFALQWQWLNWVLIRRSGFQSIWLDLEFVHERLESTKCPELLVVCWQLEWQQHKVQQWWRWSLIEEPAERGDDSMTGGGKSTSWFTSYLVSQAGPPFFISICFIVFLPHCWTCPLSTFRPLWGTWAR